MNSNITTALDNLLATLPPAVHDIVTAAYLSGVHEALRHIPRGDNLTSANVSVYIMETLMESMVLLGRVERKPRPENN